MHQRHFVVGVEVQQRQCNVFVQVPDEAEEAVPAEFLRQAGQEGGFLLAVGDGDRARIHSLSIGEVLTPVQ